MLRQGGTLLLALLVLAVMPATALAAAHVSKIVDSVIVTGTDGDDALSIMVDESDFYVSGTGLTAGTGCTQPMPGGWVRCSKASVTRVTLSMGGGNDDWPNSTGYPTQADGGAGNDKIYGSYQNDTLHGSGGDDVFYPRAGTDQVHGGAGADTASYSDLVDYFDLPAAVRVSLDDQANDGTTGASSNVHADVEDVVGSIGPDQIVGSGAANRLIGGAGADTISADDGVADTLDCGDGSDSATIDALDQVTGCEALAGSGAPATGGEPAPGGGGAPGGTDPNSPAPGDTPTPESSGPSPVGVAAARVLARWRARSSTLVRRLLVTGTGPGARIRVACAGKRRGCPFRARTLPARSTGTSLTKLFRRAALRPRAVVEIHVTQPGMTAKVFRFTIRRNRAPAARLLCLPPGARAPGACT